MNYTVDNEKLGLYVGDDIVLDNIWWAKAIPAIVVGFHADGKPLVAIHTKGYGSDNYEYYQEGVHSDIAIDLQPDVEDGIVRLYNLSNDPATKEFKMAECFGLRLGDVIELGRTSHGSLIITDKAWDRTGRYPPVQGTVIGFKKNAKGKITAPLLGIDRRVSRIKGSSAPWSIEKQGYITERYQDKWGENNTQNLDVHSDQGFCYITASTVFKKVSIAPVDRIQTPTETTERNDEGVHTMSNTTTDRPAFFDMVKSDASSAGYRIAASQLTKGARSGILSLLERYGSSSEGLKAFGEMLDTDYGTALIALTLGVSGHYAPVGIMQDPRIQKICNELRISAMANVGNSLMEEVMAALMPVVMGVIAGLPEATTNARIATSQNTEVEEEYSTVNKKVARV